MILMNRTHKIITKSLIIFAVTNICILTFFQLSPHAQAASISDMQSQYAQLEQKQKQLQGRADSASQAANNGQSNLNTLNEQINMTNQQISILQTQVQTTNDKIHTLEGSIQTTQTAVEKDMDLLKKRLRALYENSNTSFLDSLLSSSNISDFLNRIQIVDSVLSHDQHTINDLKQKKSLLESQQKDLKRSQQQLTQSQSELSSKQNDLNGKISTQAQAVSQAQATAQSAQQEAQSTADQAKQVHTQISAAYAEQAAEQRAAKIQAAENAAAQQNNTHTANANTNTNASANGSTSSTTVPSQTNTSVKVGGSSIEGSSSSYKSTVTKVAAEYGMSEYVNLILAVIQQESGGQEADIMQSLANDSNPNPTDSIYAGIQELKGDLEEAGCTGPSDIPGIELALQGYNFGGGFITWAQKNGGYSLSNATTFAQMQAGKLHWGGYGDPSYVPHVLRYYNH